MAERNYKVSRFGKGRFCIVSTETGEILDNAQGYGYKTPKNAYASYGYKNRDKSKDKFDSKLVQQMLDDAGLKPDFTAAELLFILF